MRQTGNFGQSYPNEVNTIIRVLVLLQKFHHQYYNTLSNCNCPLSEVVSKPICIYMNIGARRVSPRHPVSH